MSQQAPHVADPYRTLGVRRAATEAEIKAAHRKLAKRFHPDTDGGDTRRFLRIQEAYRVLSDPLLRREWDARHAPGPIRADRGERPPRPARARSAAKAAAAPAETPPRTPDPRREPRSSRAYTWSATEVPWWEEGVHRDARRRASQAKATDGSAGAGPEAEVSPATSAEAPNEFDVYNRSSGAAWSMAARAYFRRGEQDLPRRGSFHHQGSQPLTAARARTAAEHERRRAAASAAAASSTTAASSTAAAASAATAGLGGTARAAPPPPAPAAARPAPTADQSRDRIVSRALPKIWPSVAQRMVYALIAWLPFAAAIILASSARIDEVMQGAMMALVLGLLALVPRLAYVLAVATLGLLVVGFFFIVALAWLGFPLPLSTGMTAAVGAALALGYIATAGIVALGPSALRPWARQPQHVRSR